MRKLNISDGAWRFTAGAAFFFAIGGARTGFMFLYAASGLMGCITALIIIIKQA